MLALCTYYGSRICAEQYPFNRSPIRRHSPWSSRIQEQTERRQASAHSSQHHQRISQKWDGADSAAMPWGNCRADYMECIDRHCLVWRENFEVSHHSKEPQTFAWCRIYPGLHLSGRWMGLGIYMQMAVALSYERVRLYGIMSSIKAESISYLPWPGGRTTMWI